MAARELGKPDAEKSRCAGAGCALADRIRLDPVQSRVAIPAADPPDNAIRLRFPCIAAAMRIDAVNADQIT